MSLDSLKKVPEINAVFLFLEWKSWLGFRNTRYCKDKDIVLIEDSAHGIYLNQKYSRKSWCFLSPKIITMGQEGMVL